MRYAVTRGRGGQEQTMPIWWEPAAAGSEKWSWRTTKQQANKKKKVRNRKRIWHRGTSSRAFSHPVDNCRWLSLTTTLYKGSQCAENVNALCMQSFKFTAVAPRVFILSLICDHLLCATLGGTPFPWNITYVHKPKCTDVMPLHSISGCCRLMHTNKLRLILKQVTHNFIQITCLEWHKKILPNNL